MTRLRTGLHLGAHAGVEHYELPSRRLGARPGVNLDNALALAGELGDDEIRRKLDLRK